MTNKLLPSFLTYSVILTGDEYQQNKQSIFAIWFFSNQKMLVFCLTLRLIFYGSANRQIYFSAQKPASKQTLKDKKQSSEYGN